MNRRNGTRTRAVLAENTTPSPYLQVLPSSFDSPLPSSPASPSESSTEASSPSIFVSQEGALPPTRPHCRKKSPSHIPRPPNAFILFRSHFIRSQHVSSNVESNHSTLSKIIGLTWKSLGEEEKEVWYSRARKAEAEHKRKWPKYAFRPAHGGRRSKGDGSGVEGEGGFEACDVFPVNGRLRGGGGDGRKRTREIEPADETRCMKIAEYLSQGLRGKELDDAIREYDLHHVVPVVTRFEVPLTAEGYAGGKKVAISSALPSFQEVSCIGVHRGDRPSSSSPPPSSSSQPNPQEVPDQRQSSEPVSLNLSFNPLSHIRCIPTSSSPSIPSTVSFGNLSTTCSPAAPSSSHSSIPLVEFDFLGSPTYPSSPINMGYDDTLPRHVPSLDMLSPSPIPTSPSAPSMPTSPSTPSSVSSDSLEAYPAPADGCYSSPFPTTNDLGSPCDTARIISTNTFPPPILHGGMWQTSFSPPGLASPTRNAGGYVCDSVSGLEYLHSEFGWYGQGGLGEVMWWREKCA